MILSKKKRYLQIALNSTLAEAHQIIQTLPISERVLLEAGTPLIKEFGKDAIRQIYIWWALRIKQAGFTPYVVADLKTMDRGETEVKIATQAGASAAVCLGQAPVETIDSFIENCEKQGVDSMVDMMNINFPINILRKLKKPPNVVLLHRGVDEEKFNKDKPNLFCQQLFYHSALILKKW